MSTELHVDPKKKAENQRRAMAYALAFQSESGQVLHRELGAMLMEAPPLGASPEDLLRHVGRLDLVRHCLRMAQLGTGLLQNPQEVV